jgi:hypothetical protein
VNGQQQRKALSAAERAIQALVDGDADKARHAAGEASALDQISVYSALPGAVEAAAREIEVGSGVSPEAWAAVSRSLGPGPLAAWAAEQADS